MNSLHRLPSYSFGLHYARLTEMVTLGEILFAPLPTTLLVGQSEGKELALHLTASHRTWRHFGAEELIEVRLEEYLGCSSILSGSDRRLG